MSLPEGGSKTKVESSLMLNIPLLPCSVSCHHCGDTTAIFTCQTVGCGRIYCKKCLMRTYRYSRKALKKVKKMKDWGCPYCRHKCVCSACVGNPKEGTSKYVEKRKRAGVLLKKEVAIIQKEANLSSRVIAHSVPEVADHNVKIEISRDKKEDEKENEIAEEAKLGPFISPANLTFTPARQPYMYMPQFYPPLSYNVMQVVLNQGLPVMTPYGAFMQNQLMQAFPYQFTNHYGA